MIEEAERAVASEGSCLLPLVPSSQDRAKHWDNRHTGQRPPPRLAAFTDRPPVTVNDRRLSDWLEVLPT